MYSVSLQESLWRAERPATALEHKLGSAARAAGHLGEPLEALCTPSGPEPGLASRPLWSRGSEGIGDGDRGAQATGAADDDRDDRLGRGVGHRGSRDLG